MKPLAMVLLTGTFLILSVTTSVAQSEGSAADEVILLDGSVLKGQIVFVESDYLYFESEYYDPIKISVWDVRSVTTGGVVDVVVDTGERWRGTIGANTQGEMIFTPQEGGGARPLNFGFVDGVYQLRSIWDNDLTIGLSSTAGNADVLGISLLSKGQRDSEVHRFTWSAQGTYARAEGREVAQNWTGSAKYDYFIRPRLYVGFAEELRHDRFKDLRVRSVSSASLGYVFLRKPEMEFEGEIGGGILAQRFYQAEDFNEFALRTSAYYKMPIGKDFTLQDLLIVYVSNGTDRTQVANTFTFEWEITNRWGLEIVNLFNHDSEESFFAEGSDSQWTVGLAYTF